MRRTESLIARMVLSVCAFACIHSAAEACSRSSPISIYTTCAEADVIVRAVAVRYLAAPEGNSWTTGIPNSKIEFKVTEILKGRKVPRSVAVKGYLSERNDFNDRPVPFDFVRPGGRSGSCYANSYKKGAQFLLFLKKEAGDFTPYWDPLAPVNEQLRSDLDPWLFWVKGYLRGLAEGDKRKR